MSTGSISVGQLVRVALIRGPGAEEGVMCRAIVACCNEDDTYDVIYNSNSYEQTEEGSVPRARVSALEDFEAGAEYGPAAAAVDSPVEEPTALELKERGNRLFQLKDYDAAREQYVCAQRSVAPQPPPTVGSRVVVLDKLGEYLPGTVCNAEGNSVVDVIYDMEGADGTDEEDRVSLSRVILLAIDGAPQQLQGILFMNLAKVSLKLRRNGWAIRYAACAIGIMGVDHAAAAEQAKKLIDAYYFRAKDASRMADCGDKARSDALVRQIAVHREQRRREDRKLARDVAKWVESAMEISAAAGAAGQADAMIVEDF